MSIQMYLINAHAIPIEGSEQYGKVIGAHVVAYINFADVDGAYELAKYYIMENGWQVTEMEEECFLVDAESGLQEDQAELYNEALKEGYALVFYTYESEDEE